MHDDPRALPDPSGTGAGLPDDPACNQVVELLTAYLDGALSARDTRLLEGHLAECPPCATYLEQVRATVRVAGTLRDTDVAEPLMRVLLDAFRAGGQDR